MDGAFIDDGHTRPSTNRRASLKRPCYRRARITSRTVASAIYIAALSWLTLASGCASGRMPTIDPTGERFFVLGPVVRQPEPPPPHCHDPVRVELTPAKIIAP